MLQDDSAREVLRLLDETRTLLAHPERAVLSPQLVPNLLLRIESLIEEVAPGEQPALLRAALTRLARDFVAQVDRRDMRGPDAPALAARIRTLASR